MTADYPRATFLILLALVATTMLVLAYGVTPWLATLLFQLLQLAILATYLTRAVLWIRRRLQARRQTVD